MHQSMTNYGTTNTLRRFPNLIIDTKRIAIHDGIMSVTCHAQDHENPVPVGKTRHTVRRENTHPPPSDVTLIRQKTADTAKRVVVTTQVGQSHRNLILTERAIVVASCSVPAGSVPPEPSLTARTLKTNTTASRITRRTALNEGNSPTTTHRAITPYPRTQARTSCL